MKGKLVKLALGYILFDERGIPIGHTPNVLDNGTFSKLSPQNCQDIESGYDLEELVSEYGADGLNDDIYFSFKAGFQKALELMGDKKFSEEDMIREIHKWDSYINIHEEDKGSLREITKRVESLQQKEWDVEIVMECPQCQEWGYISECRNSCNQKFLQPKIDSEGCLILKKIK